MSEDGTQDATQDATTGTGGNDGGDNTTDTTKTGDTTTQDSGKGSDAGGSENGGNATVTREEFDALQRRMQAADRRATAAENKLKDADKAKLGELERAKLEAEEAKAESGKAANDLRTARLENAFLTDSVKWHDSADAFLILSRDFMDGVEINDQGKVVGMDAAVKKMVRVKPHLVKTETASEATGSAHNGTRKGDGKDTIDKTAMASRFPAAFPR